jgi:hypothetical protein
MIKRVCVLLLCVVFVVCLASTDDSENEEFDKGLAVAALIHPLAVPAAWISMITQHLYTKAANALKVNTPFLEISHFYPLPATFIESLSVEYG